MSLHLKKRWVTGPTCSELHNKRSSMDGRTPMAHNSGNKATLTSNLNKCENQNQLGDPAERMRRVSFKPRLYIIYTNIHCFFQEKRRGSNFWDLLFLYFGFQINLGMHPFQSICCKFKKHSPKIVPVSTNLHRKKQKKKTATKPATTRPSCYFHRQFEKQWQKQGDDQKRP